MTFRLRITSLHGHPVAYPRYSLGLIHLAEARAALGDSVNNLTDMRVAKCPLIEMPEGVAARCGDIYKRTNYHAILVDGGYMNDYVVNVYTQGKDGTAAVTVDMTPETISYFVSHWIDLGCPNRLPVG